MFKLTKEMAEHERKLAQTIDYKELNEIGAGRYGRVAYELLREHQPSVFCEFYFNKRFKEWIIEQNEKWSNREVELFAEIKEEYDKIPVAYPMDRITQATTAQEQAREIVLSEIKEELPELNDVLRPHDLFSSF